MSADHPLGKAKPFLTLDYLGINLLAVCTQTMYHFAELGRDRSLESLASVLDLI